MFKEIQNKKVFLEYEILKKFECGIVLTGSEVKSIKLGNAKILGGMVLVRNGEAFVSGLEIGQYKFDARKSIHEKRSKKLLLKKSEILKIDLETKNKGITCVPVKLFLKDRFIKLQIAIVRGLKKWDKRELEKKKQDKKEIDRITKNLMRR